MSVKEKVAIEDGKKVHCYKQGSIWVCYEHSAYLIFQDKVYKPAKKWIKNTNKEVISIGFPQKALTLARTNLTCLFRRKRKLSRFCKCLINYFCLIICIDYLGLVIS
ncbi:hypothetical protein [uncultured Flavobacterium sp.]|uniref:hypothetical protein n=1 Tax=uncultured Flavobacterium sp. TaxID=165435 RepID=UPI0030CA3528